MQHPPAKKDAPFSEVNVEVDGRQFEPSPFLINNSVELRRGEHSITQALVIDDRPIFDDGVGADPRGAKGVKAGCSASIPGDLVMGIGKYSGWSLVADLSGEVVKEVVALIRKTEKGSMHSARESSFI